MNTQIFNRKAKAADLMPQACHSACLAANTGQQAESLYPARPNLLSAADPAYRLDGTSSQSAQSTVAADFNSASILSTNSGLQQLPDAVIQASMSGHYAASSAVTPGPREAVLAKINELGQPVADLSMVRACLRPLKQPCVSSLSLLTADHCRNSTDSVSRQLAV